MLHSVGFHTQVECLSNSKMGTVATEWEIMGNIVIRFLIGLITSLLTHLQHRREIRLAAAARVREKQMVKEIQKMKRTEAKQDLTKDVTADVFLTPAEEKPVHIETEAPEPKVAKKNHHKAFKRQRMQMAHR